MSEPGKGDPNSDRPKSFAHRLTGEALRQFKEASPEEKLRWLEEANAFVQQFVSREKQDRWERIKAEGEGPERTRRAAHGKK